MQLGAQYLPDQVMNPVIGPVIIEGHQEQVGFVDAAQQPCRVVPPGDGGAGASCELVGNRGIEHELGDLGGLLLKDLGDEVVRNRVAADILHPARVMCESADGTTLVLARYKAVLQGAMTERMAHVRRSSCMRRT
jgi:hypothetical protein